MENEQPFSNEKSLALIQQMIRQARSNITDSGSGWLLWGTLIFLTCVSTYIFIDIGSENIFLAWNIFGGITVIMLLVDIFRPRRKTVLTYVDEVMRYVNIAFIVSLFTIIISINISVSPNSGFGYFLMIFAILMLVNGGALKSRALIIGAALNWAGAIAIFINKEFKYDMLIMAGAVMAGYIIPGLIMRAQYRKLRQKDQL